MDFDIAAYKRRTDRLRWDDLDLTAFAAHRLPAGVTYSDALDRLETGRYEVRVRGTAPNQAHSPLDVTGGTVTELRITSQH